MKYLALLLSLSLISFPDAFAAFQSYPIRNRISIVRMDYDGEPGSRSHEVLRNPTLFRVEVISDSEGIKPESSRNGRPFIAAQKDERFAVRLYNPLPVRVAVNLTVDGLNSITGKPSDIAGGEKWMIDPYSSVTIRGWQVNNGEARRFFFTDKPKAYAKWTGDRMNKDLSVNCGVIGAAYFWSQKELDRYNEEHPQYRYTYRYNYPARCMSNLGLANKKAYQGVGSEAASLASPTLQAAAQSEQLAGTGMGERESNPTTIVDFRFDTGMYQLAQAVVIYYDFAAPEPTPNPFPAISFAPEMP